MKSMYANSKSCIKVNGVLSKFFEQRIGLRQGCVLSPTLFNVFINDIVQLLDAADIDPVIINGRLISLLLFADDLVILSLSAGGLQNALDRVQAYCQRWHLLINVKKSKIVCFNKRFNSDRLFFVGDNPIEQVESTKYLGVIFSCTGSFKPARKALAVRAKKALFGVGKHFNIYEGTSVVDLLHMFDMMVKPRLLYASEVWGAYLYRKPLVSLQKNLFSSRLEHDMLHLKACKHILGLKKYSSNVGVYAELGRLPLIFNILVSIFKFVRHVILDENNIAKCIMDMEFQCYQKGQTSFLAIIESLFSLVGRKFVALDDCINLSVGCIKKGLETVLEEECRSAVTTSPKLQWYTLVKNSYPFRERYLDVIKNPLFRRAVTKIRLSDHDFDIERGRRCRVPRQDRVCSHCDSGDVGDEFHTLFLCEHSSLVELRQAFVSSVCGIVESFDLLNPRSRFLYCLTAADLDICVLVGKFFNQVLNFVKSG